VVVRRVLERERLPVPWRILLRTFRSLELRGEALGGRFVQGCDGEHFATQPAIELLRKVRKRQGGTLRVGAADPLNLRGILTPDPRIAPQTRSWVEVL
jgi:ATP-dependent Lhr-like helicase